MRKSRRAVCGFGMAAVAYAAHGGPSGGAIRLDGVDDFARGQHAFSSPAFTIEAWVNVTSLTISPISSGGSVATYGLGNAQVFSLWLIPDAPGVLDEFSPRLQVNFSNGVSRITPAVDNPQPFGEWVHVAASYDGTTARVYADGQVVAEDDWGVVVNQLPAGSLYIGNEFPGVSEYFGGDIDELRIWTRALSSAEISGLYETALCPDQVPDLWAYYQFDALGLGTFFDSTENAHHLEPSGTGASKVVSSAPLVSTPVCEPCSAVDLSEPFGVLNFLDLSVFLTLFNAMDPSVDYAAPAGVFNFLDLGEFLTLFNQGCS